MYWDEATTSLLKPLIEPTPNGRIGLISDFDGTLSPIVPNPDDARATERSRAALQILVTRLALVAFVSGRAVNDLRARANLPGAVYVGNHGMEKLTETGIVTPPQVTAVRPAFDLLLGEIGRIEIDGLRMEDKRVSLSLHYRNTADPEAVAAQLDPILEKLTYQHGLRLHRGRMVFEIRPPFEINKGTALKSLIETHKLTAAVFIGDDTTDADAMRVARQLRESGACHAVAVGVESDETPKIVIESADVLTQGISGVEDFLEWLAESVNRSAST